MADEGLRRLMLGHLTGLAARRLHHREKIERDVPANLERIKLRVVAWM